MRESYTSGRDLYKPRRSTVSHTIHHESPALPGLRNDNLTVVFPAGSYSTRRIAASSDRLIEVNSLSQRSQYASQSLKERAQLVRI